MRRSPQQGQTPGGGARDWNPSAGERRHVCRRVAATTGSRLSARAMAEAVAGSAWGSSRSVSDCRGWAAVAPLPGARRSRASRFSLIFRSGEPGRDSGALVWMIPPPQGAAFATADSHKRTAAKQRPATRQSWVARNVDDLDMPVIYHACVPAGNDAFRGGGDRGRTPAPARSKEREPGIFRGLFPGILARMALCMRRKHPIDRDGKRS